MRVTGALADVGIGDAGAAAGLVDHGDVRGHELVGDQDPLQGARRPVVPAARREADHDFHGALRRPALGPAGGAETEQRQCDQQCARRFMPSPSAASHASTRVTRDHESLPHGYCFTRPASTSTAFMSGVVLLELFPECRARHEVVGPVVLLEVGFPLRRLGRLAQRLLPVRDLRGRESLRARRSRASRRRPGRRPAPSRSARLASVPPKRCGAPTPTTRILPAATWTVALVAPMADDVDVAAEQRGDRLGRALEHDDLQVARIAADRFHEQRDGDVAGAAEALAKPIATDCGSFFRRSARSLPVLIGELACDRDHHVVVEQQGDAA